MITLDLLLPINQNPIIKEFKDSKQLQRFIRHQRKKANVWLFAIEQIGVNDIIIVDESLCVIHYACDHIGTSETRVFLQGYNSYEDAYKSALEMRELNPLCYNT